ncbi:MAG: 4-alpha-glucanotransferase [Deltaproteobacteria bacterium]|nr:4-alpha-glucanotransferase [Deltaproteobacteria bacterium]
MKRDPASPGHGPRLAGFAVPLFSLRSRRGGAIGEIDDLVPLCEWAADAGHRVIALLPLGELGPGEASPYNALSSFAIDPLYLTPATIEELRGDSIPAGPDSTGVVDRERARAWKQPLFDEAVRRFRALAARHDRRRCFDDFRGRAPWLADYALFRALFEEHAGRSWRQWPEALRRRDSRALGAARRRLAARILAFEYLQFAAAEAWSRVRRAADARGVRLMGDLPFAPSENSADVWANRSIFDLSRSVGAPPDAFSASGQRWGLPMYRWAVMRRQGWPWLRRRVRRMAELYDLFRVDHVVGLFRTFHFFGDVPNGFDPPGESAQIAQGREILRWMIDEGKPAQVVAEDLGVVPEFVTAALAALDVPGYKVLRWVRQGDRFVDPASYPECSIATTGTHDTDSLVEWWGGLPPPPRRALLDLLPVRDGDGAELSPEVRRAILGRLYASPSRMVILPVQDLFGWPQRINTPATIGDDNWRFRLPVEVERLGSDERIAAESAALRALIDAAGRLRRMG